MASIGSSLGPYQLKAKIGAGGMGEVYLAFDSRLGRDVAIKILPPQFIADPERVRRFEQEARATAALSHPNILAIFDVGTTEDAFYVVTEFLEGETLRTRINNGALATRKAMDYATQIACGLAAAHDRGIIHRDLKPENIFVTRDGRVKILDFGLAKLASFGKADDRTLGTKELETGAGVVLGTLGYMSPEQVRGGTVDARSDLFSFGAILYEMVSGQRAFHCATAADTISAILNDDPPELSRTRRDISPGLERVVPHCLEKDPGERFQAARDLMFALQGTSASSSQAVGVPPLASARTRRKGLRTIAGACLGAMVCVGTFLLGWFLKPAPSPTFRQITFRQGTVTAARFAPDGQNLVYSAAWDGTHPEIFSARTDSVLSRSLDVRDADVLAMSSQGEIALLQRWRFLQGWTRSGTLSRTALTGGAAKELLEGVQDPDWSSDGNSLAIIRSKPHYQLEFPVGHVLLTAAGEHWMSDLRVAPGQHHIAFFDHPFEGDDQGSVCIIDVEGKEQVLS